MKRPRCGESGFTLIELLVVIAIIALLIGILLPALGEARRAAKLTIAIAREKQMATATHSYGADYQDRIFSFTWRPNETVLFMEADGTIVSMNTSDMGDGDILDIASHQAIDTIRRRADRIGNAAIQVPSNWIPHVLYSHLVLQDYLASRLPEELVVNPEDRVRLNWQIDPTEKFDHNFWAPLQPDPSNPDNLRWPYSASFQTVPASYDGYQSDLTPGAEVKRISQSTQHNGYVLGQDPESPLGDLRLSDVSFAAQKVHLMDSHQRHFGEKQPFYAIKSARVPLAFFDSSVSVRSTSDSNVGWRPTSPLQPCMAFKYLPDAWEPPTTSGDQFDIVVGHYQWTRGGLKGVDFGGKDLDWNDLPDCPWD